MALVASYVDMSYNAKRRRISIISIPDELEHDQQATVISIFETNPPDWGASQVPNVRGQSLVVGDTCTWMVCRTGEFMLLSSAGRQTEQLPDSGYTHGRKLGPPTMMRMIEGELYVCGMSGQVYVRRKDKLQHMDDGLAEPGPNTKSQLTLNAIHGTAANDIYVVGSGGLIAHWNGKKWTKLPVLTNVQLWGVRCFSKNHIVAVGSMGVIVEGDGKKWKVEQLPDGAELTLSDVETFKGDLYVAAVDDLYVRKKGRWDVVEHGLDEDRTDFYRLLVAEERLWTMGTHRLSSTNGRKWAAHIDPDNG
ncbi:MAG TPA: hypothetical protein VKN99_05270 [Polyangia bacterium]|nr:hypothetical protein [Polyangia bacterium]